MLGVGMSREGVVKAGGGGSVGGLGGSLPWLPAGQVRKLVAP